MARYQLSIIIIIIIIIIINIITSHILFEETQKQVSKPYILL